MNFNELLLAIVVGGSVVAVINFVLSVIYTKYNRKNLIAHGKREEENVALNRARSLEARGYRKVIVEGKEVWRPKDKAV